VTEAIPLIPTEDKWVNQENKLAIVCQISNNVKHEAYFEGFGIVGS
jgi:hypothetical protein